MAKRRPHRDRPGRQPHETPRDPVEALVLRAESAPSRRQALDLYQQAVAAAEKALGPEVFRDGVGHFWGILETRVYMHARLGLAHALWTAGRREEAVGHLRDMLRLNPNDNQGVRYALAGFLFALDRDDDVTELLGKYPEEGSAAWAYSKALLAFRREGDTPHSRELRAAEKTNRHVPDYLVGRKMPPAERPHSYSPGQESEAQVYIGSFLAGWQGTPGAVAWLRANDEKARKRKAEAPQPRGPLGFVKKWVRERLPQREDVWQADCRRMPTWVKIDGLPVRMWLILVTSRSDDLVLAHQMVEDVPSPALLWDALLEAMQSPAAGEPHRPTEVRVLRGGILEEIRAHVEEIGVRLVAADGLDHLEAAFAGLSAHLGAKAEPGLLDAPGVRPEQAAAFYDAAATFYEQAPWKRAGYEAGIRIECARFQNGPWYAVLMGQSGLVIGLALYDDLETLRAMWAKNVTDEQNVRRTVGTSVMFGEEWTVSIADADAARRLGWRLAHADAWPALMRLDHGHVSRPPAADLGRMEACLRAVPEFVRRRGQDDPTAEAISVQTATGPAEMTLSWVVDEA